VAYDIHVVRTKDWLKASESPITKRDVDIAIAADPELEWSTSDYVDMAELHDRLEQSAFLLVVPLRDSLFGA
jgi:hypothetical protein